MRVERGVSSNWGVARMGLRGLLGGGMVRYISVDGWIYSWWMEGVMMREERDCGVGGEGWERMKFAKRK
jgi:hypothetical protein